METNFPATRDGGRFDCGGGGAVIDNLFSGGVEVNKTIKNKEYQDRYWSKKAFPGETAKEARNRYYCGRRLRAKEARQDEIWQREL